MKEFEFSCRVANKSDIASIAELMRLSIEINMKAFLSAEQIEANKESMGVDLTLIEDGSYFVVETFKEGEKVLVGCGVGVGAGHCLVETILKAETTVFRTRRKNRQEFVRCIPIQTGRGRG